MYYKLKPKTGNHAQKNKKGVVEIFESKDGKVFESEDDLCKMFPGKFEEVNTPSKKRTAKKAPTAAKKAVKDEVTPNSEEGEGNEEKQPVPKGAFSVTKKFPTAVDQDFKVLYKKFKGYFVTEADDPTMAFNTEKLKKADVEEFIENLIRD